MSRGRTEDERALNGQELIQERQARDAMKTWLKGLKAQGNRNSRTVKGLLDADFRDIEIRRLRALARSGRLRARGE